MNDPNLALDAGQPFDQYKHHSLDQCFPGKYGNSHQREGEFSDCMPFLPSTAGRLLSPKRPGRGAKVAHKPRSPQNTKHAISISGSIHSREREFGGLINNGFSIRNKEPFLWRKPLKNQPSFLSEELREVTLRIPGEHFFCDTISLPALRIPAEKRWQEFAEFALERGRAVSLSCLIS